MSSHINKAWGPLLRRRSALPALLTVLAVGFALIAVAPSVTRGREMLLKTACVEAPGYEAFPEYVTTYSSGDVLPSFDNDYSEGSFHHDAASALLACDSDPNCIGYNTLGFTFTKAGFKSVSWTNEGICQYIKIGSSGAFSGYTRRPYLTWIPTETDTIFIDMASPAAAKKACDQNPACTAWNTAGQYAVGAVDTKNFEASPGGTTLYLKQVCPEKFGYTSYHGFTLSGVSGVNGVGTGKMPGGSADAADFCKLNYPCTAFSTDGSYAIGAVNLKNSDNSTCTYVKEPCSPMRGFYAVNDANSGFTPDSRPYYNCFSDVYKACLNDPDCVAFNNVRNIYTMYDFNLKSAPGICFYYKFYSYRG